MMYNNERTNLAFSMVSFMQRDPEELFPTLQTFFLCVSTEDKGQEAVKQKILCQSQEKTSQSFNVASYI